MPWFLKEVRIIARATLNARPGFSYINPHPE
jgi:hypothetical protein